METWIKPNRRAMSFALIPNSILLLVGALLPLFFSHWGVWLLGTVLILVGGVGTLGVLLMMRLPRLGYRDGQLLVFLQRGAAICVPIEEVECFFLGQADSFMPKSGGDESHDSETTTVVVRLAEAAEQWKHKEVLPALGHWCDGYITIRGTWCEPINGPLIQRLNGRLVQVHRECKERRQAADTQSPISSPSLTSAGSAESGDR